MKTYTCILASVLGLWAVASLQVSAQEQKPYVGSEAFERMKQLLGSWEGTMDMGKGPQKITASYKLTSGGSAIVETVFEGADHEMVTVYHDNSTHTLSMTHYCMLGNQPKMMLKGMEDDELVFDLATDADILVAKEPHMHSLTIGFGGNDTMTQQWTNFEGGKRHQVVQIAYTRTR